MGYLIPLAKTNCIYSLELKYAFFKCVIKYVLLNTGYTSIVLKYLQIRFHFIHQNTIIKTMSDVSIFSWYDYL